MAVARIDDLCYVAYVDILGFSDMVRQEFESPDGTQRYLPKLRAIHEDTMRLRSLALPIKLVQFSDSIVLSTPFDLASFGAFLGAIARHQWGLLTQGILVRGGVSSGHHYDDNGLMFSQGLVEAYELECQQARFPRIVVSSDLIDLLYPYPERMPRDLPLLRERDGRYFVDYASAGAGEQVAGLVDWIQAGIDNRVASISEKFLWLSEYLRFKFGNVLPDTPRFSGRPEATGEQGQAIQLARPAS